jgi:hypothetical protein
MCIFRKSASWGYWLARTLVRSMYRIYFVRTLSWHRRTLPLYDCSCAPITSLRVRLFIVTIKVLWDDDVRVVSW